MLADVSEGSVKHFAYFLTSSCLGIVGIVVWILDYPVGLAVATIGTLVAWSSLGFWIQEKVQTSPSRFLRFLEVVRSSLANQEPAWPPEKTADQGSGRSAARQDAPSEGRSARASCPGPRP